jgi:hypothetical protein
MSVDTTFGYPVDERIAQVAQQRLESIDIITGVIRESRKVNNWTPEDRQILLIKDPPQRATEFDTIGNPPGIAYTMNLHVRCHVLQSQVADEPVEELLSIIVADAVRAITNAADWHKFDGHCLDATIGNFERSSFDGAFDVATLIVTVVYRIKETDPYQIQC